YSVREHDAVFRVGGEEFAVVMPGLAAGDAAAVAERIRAEVAHAPFTLPLRVSIGLASWPADARDRDALLARADDALYAAKRAGKDRVVAAAVAGETAGRPAAGGGRTNLLDLLRAKVPAVVSLSDEVGALDVARFVLEHHERVDGSGYPQGLAGEDISLEGRVLHAVDAYAAMVSDRPYRSAMHEADALDELRRGSGTQFDAGVVRVLEDLLG